MFGLQNSEIVSTMERIFSVGLGAVRNYTQNPQDLASTTTAASTTIPEVPYPGSLTSHFEDGVVTSLLLVLFAIVLFFLFVLCQWLQLRSSRGGYQRIYSNDVEHL